MANLSKEHIQELRKELADVLRCYNGTDKIKFEMSNKTLESLLFKEEKYENGDVVKTFAIDFDLIKKID